MNKIIILECFDCSGSIQISDKMLDERYIISHCPYCGSEEIETDVIEIVNQDD